MHYLVGSGDGPSPRTVVALISRLRRHIRRNLRMHRHIIRQLDPSHRTRSRPRSQRCITQPRRRIKSNAIPPAVDFIELRKPLRIHKLRVRPRNVHRNKQRRRRVPLVDQINFRQLPLRMPKLNLKIRLPSQPPSSHKPCRQRKEENDIHNQKRKQEFSRYGAHGYSQSKQSRVYFPIVSIALSTVERKAFRHKRMDCGLPVAKTRPRWAGALCCTRGDVTDNI